MTTAARQKAHRLGHTAEWRAVWRLRLAGFSILARRYKTRLGEIDIVARRGDLLIFVEVKARGDLLVAVDALGNRQFGRVSRAASLFLARHPRYAASSVRFDAVVVSGPLWRQLWPRHLPDVWRAPE
ncbi:MAG: YraN family protein [Reyranella sp.]|uniref:YraN family protein n=1 Tax=Reyranella sp. TaxID=1929291 RepID=UPI0027304386|nr:YraN family protein [Reyranella sp.]MDP1965329.1 YraN family protein [Reyranella sp.]MDP2376077.1 YraN family protein [Reyranella sp.]